MSSACYALRYVKHSLPVETLKVIYFSQVHTIISYGVIFWATLPTLTRYSYCIRKLLELLLMLDQGTLVGKFLGICGF
jgi:hypothetical protein